MEAVGSQDPMGGEGEWGAEKLPDVVGWVCCRRAEPCSSCPPMAYGEGGVLMAVALACFSPDVGGPADPIAPTIIVPPRNTSVVAGTSEVTMECVANAR